MNARPQIREKLLEIRMRRWCKLARYPLLNIKCPPARARKNYWRLLKSYPEIAARLDLHELSVYER